MDIALYTADLSFLFEHPSVWLSLVQVLIAVIPVLIGLSGYAMWRTGERHGLSMMVWVAGYLAWIYWPIPFEEALILPGRIVSVILWVWLVQAWQQRLRWHEPLLLAANFLTACALLTLIITLAIATIRDVMDWDQPSQSAEFLSNLPIV